MATSISPASTTPIPAVTPSAVQLGPVVGAQVAADTLTKTPSAQAPAQPMVQTTTQTQDEPKTTLQGKKKPKITLRLQNLWIKMCEKLFGRK